MAAPKSLLWSMDRHTQAKHEILQRYLEAWFPILISYTGKSRVIDGFAGPGEYQEGQRGSPLIALDVLLEHTHKPVRQGNIELIFIEQDPQRSQHLQQLIAKQRQQKSFPATLTCTIMTGTFSDKMEMLLLRMEQQRTNPTPTFSFIDPFGYSQIPMDIIKRLMALPMCEVLITFMAEEINRFLTVDYCTKDQHYDQLFGTDEWRHIPRHSDSKPGQRIQYVHDLYQQQLLTVGGAKYVRSFCMKNKKNATDYFLFFGTKSLDGLNAMKQAMWKTDPTGTFEFSDFTNPHQPLLLTEPNYEDMRQRLCSYYKGQTVSPQAIREYILAQTPYWDNFKLNALKPLESAGKITVSSTNPKRKRGSYKDQETLITFL